MRLLKRKPDDDLQLVSVNDGRPPPYAILSHTWSEGQEVTYDELVAGKGKNKTGYAKILFCVDQAAKDGIEYCWVDTCCIDKSTQQELQTAINSMFRWYQSAQKCYVYLSDVQVPKEVSDAQAFPISWIQAFRQSRWFTRGWTLQELLAPPNVEFFSKEGKRLGSRVSLQREVCEITRVPVEALKGQRILEFSFEERMRWAANRTTTWKEDKIYCLLGIFGVYLPLIYGEGEAYAEDRLREEIDRRRKGQGIKAVEDLAVSSPLPFPRDELFTGRKKELQSLDEFLQSNVHRRITIYGLGGCGKSALAIEFAYRALVQRAGRLVFWVLAISRDSFELAYKDIGVRLRVPGINDDNSDIKQLVKDALDSTITCEWLMIIDNADDPQVLISSASTDVKVARLVDYLPKSDRGKIIFTTRNRKAAGDLTRSSKLELKDIDEAEAKQLLSRRVTNQALLADRKGVDELLKLLAYLPLALVQAAAFIDNNDIAVSKYIALVRDAGTTAELFGEHFEDPNRYQEMDSTIAKTWHISFEQIRKQDALAAEYLSFMACIDRIKIPQSLLPPHSSLVQQAKAIGTLKGYAFVTERQQVTPGSANETLFDVHRLVHMAVAWWLKGQDEQDAWVAKAAARLEELVPYGGHKNKDRWTSYLSHANHMAGLESILNDETRTSLLDRVGRCQASLGRYPAAETAHRQALSIREKRPGIEHELVLLNMNEIGVTLDSQGKYTEAETMHKQTLAMYKKVLGVEHLDTLVSMNNLALVLEHQGKFTEAETMYRDTLAMNENVLGVEHPTTLTTMSNLAAVLGRQGKHTEAEAMYREKLLISEKVLGAEHPGTLTMMNNLALILDSQGKYEEAETMHQQTLAMREEVLGAEHPSTLTTMHNLAGVLKHRGRYMEAEKTHKRTLAMREKVLGAEHPSTLTTMNNLALVLRHQVKYEEAESVHKQELAIKEKVLGAEHPDTLTTMNNLAGVLDSQGKYEEAIVLYEKTYAGLVKVLGHGHPHTRTCHENYSLMFASQRQSLSGSVSDGLNVGVNLRKDRESTLSHVVRWLGFKTSRS